MDGELPPDESSELDPFPSLTSIEQELARVELAHATRSQGVDTKAGVIVGAAGVLVTLGAGSDPHVATVIGLGLASLAGGFAVWAFQPRAGLEVSPKRLIDRGYLRSSSERTRVTLLATRANFHLADEGVLVVKAARLKAAFWCLFLAVLVVLIGLVVSVSTRGDNSGTNRTPDRGPVELHQPTRTVSPTAYHSGAFRSGPHDQPRGRQPGPRSGQADR